MEKPVRPAKDGEYLSTLDRGLKVLRSFDAARPEMQLSEVAAATGLSPAVARRCLNTLVQLGYVAQHGRKFLLRPEVLSFGTAYLSSMNVEQVVLPPLQNLRDITGDSASMAVLSGSDILYVAHVSTQRHIRLGATVGTRFPLHATSLGKVLMACQPEDAIAKFLATTDFQRFTERTVTDRDALRARLNQVLANGYDSALDELDYGIVSVAVPVFDASRRAIAAINCSTSTTRISQDELVRTRLPLLREAAIEIGAALQRWPTLLRSLQ
ncbi:helix-turn-helix domain-containing protein [Sphingomonas sp. SFZ2018-12]|uniref:IclR family transcriptional regulator domain-containing protein n=1 Tax=Sphingomonas sp. SFZ2018-12 TaxID=2683197 RepID=UPI001F0D7D1C|nr:IclR family transcriptional regulator C-terminal domain-containing protein [Sphingomonas sp. SFZ2018-12]MCH4892464.1 helix-turn-helix domain-containing protein [Sphingomonas sp. SFZ2018-12]